MKIKILLVLPLLALAMSGCNKDNNTSRPYDDDDETSFPPGTMPEEPSSTGGSGSGGDIITSTDDGDVVITGINSVLSYPEEFDIDEGLLTTDVVLKLALNNGNFIERHPESLDYDASPAQIGQLIVVTANYGTLSTTFQSRVTIEPHDTLDVSLTSTTSDTSYKTWSYPSAVSDAQYDAISAGNGIMVLSDDNDRGIVSTHSGGRIKKIKIQWETTEPTGSKAPLLLLFLQTTPFNDRSDLALYKKNDATMQIGWQENEFTYVPNADTDYFYLGIRSCDKPARIQSISIYWDSAISVPTLSSMAFTEDSSAFAETNYTEWDLSKVKVNGTFSDDTTVDITRFVNLSSTTTIPSKAYVSYDVSVTAVWGRDTSITFTDTVRGKVDIALVTAASWTFENTVTGGTLNKTFPKGTSGDKDFLQDVSTNDEIGYLQVKSDTAYWNETPSRIVFVAEIGGSSGKDFDTSGGSSYYIYAVLLDSNGDEISETQIIIAKSIVKDKTQYTIEFPKTNGEYSSAYNNVYGVKIKHKKLDRFNVRFYSIALRYIA